MHSVSIRLARVGDDAAIGELLVEAFISAYARKMPWIVYDDERKAALRAVAEKRRVATVWVAESGGRVVGTVALFPPGAEGSQAWLPNAADLRHLATAPDLHGRGLSLALLDAAEAQARAWQVDAITLHVRRGATGVARIYTQRRYRRAPEGDRDMPTVFLEGYQRAP